MTKTIYVIDANVCINLPLRYPTDLFPSLWEFLEQLLVSERAILPEEILLETGKSSSTFRVWFDSLGVSTTYLLEYQNPDCALQRVLRVCQVQQMKGQDPVLVANAVELQDEGLIPIVVSEEKTSRDCLPLKVPDMCARFKIQCLKFFDFLRLEQFKV